MNLQDRYIAGLKRIGEVEVKRTFRYIVYSRTVQTGEVPITPGYHYYLGNAGAIRIGRTTQSSVPASNLLKACLLGG